MSGDLILGIDPGKAGALALVNLHDGALVEVFDMPTLQLKNKRELDEYRFAQLVDDWATRIADAWIETAWPRPGEANTLSFQFGTVYGVARGVVCASFIPLHNAAPVTWKKAMKVTGDKDESRHAASVLWPTETRRWPNKWHHGRCEAALIAEYGRRQFMRVLGKDAA